MVLTSIIKEKFVKNGYQFAPQHLLILIKIGIHCFIDDAHGVELICKELPIAPSTYHHHKALERNPERRSARAKRDENFVPEIRRVWEENHRNYGARKVWKQVKRDLIPVARCTVARLMKKLGIEGVRRGRRCITTIPSEVAHKPLDLVNRVFSANHPNQL